jgi:hypothetical protein
VLPLVAITIDPFGPLNCHCLEGGGILVGQLPRRGVISDLKVENEGENPGRYRKDSKD